MLYKEWIEIWLENYVQHSVRQRTYMCYKKIAENHVCKKLGELDLKDVTPYVLQRHITELLSKGNLMTGKGLSSNSVNAVITVIHNTLKIAFSIGLISDYNADRIIRPKPKERNVECFCLSEQKKIERFILNDSKSRFFGVLLCLYTGIRLGELLALEWSDIDIEKGELRINKSCHYGKDYRGVFCRITDIPKTSTSIRTIPIPKQLMLLVREEKKKSQSSHVVANGSNLVSTRSYQQSFSDLLNKLKIPHRGFHSLRHTFATRALECGMDVKTLSEILGHKNPNVTLNRYAHSLMEHKKEMMNKIGKLL